MKRNRVLSFMSGLGKPLEHREQRPVEHAQSARTTSPRATAALVEEHVVAPVSKDTPPTQRQRSNTAGRERSNSRPVSMVGGYIPPVMDIAPDTIPELFPIFTLLNSHSNKLYQEGYFLRLNDLDVHGKPYSDRSWTECFAQLVGTVLSLWDAAALDAAGEEGEVAPSFINLADASIKMALQNVLSISTAGKNRYLLHFSSYHVLAQWTGAIRLAMFENTCLQEAYTGSLIAGKGKNLNAIKQIMSRTVFQTDEWTRVRFGAGTPWRRCWCVVSPPDPKLVKQQTKAFKKSSTYSRGAPVVKGEIRFYDTSKVTKKTRPVATITDAYSTYAVYPQSRALIDQSTLIKIEGTITIHSSPEITTEGFVFVMPEVHPAVSGFEMMLRFLFPIYDIFHLYGRPTKLIADTLDTRGLMFALPQEKRYGYLELFDMTSLINMEGSARWSEQEWRKRMKNMVSEHVSKAREDALASNGGSRPTSRTRRSRNSLPGRGSLRFADGDSMRSDPSLHRQIGFAPPDRTDSAPPGDGMVFSQAKHNRSASETLGPSALRNHTAVDQYMPASLSPTEDRPSFDGQAPPPPSHGIPVSQQYGETEYERMHNEPYNRSSSEEEMYVDMPASNVPMPTQQPAVGAPEAPVEIPPALTHPGASRPGTQPRAAPDLRRANSRMSSTTLSQLAAAHGNLPTYEQGAGQDMVDRPGIDGDHLARQNLASYPYESNSGRPASRPSGLRNSATVTPGHLPSDSLTPMPHVETWQQAPRDDIRSPSPSSYGQPLTVPGAKAQARTPALAPGPPRAPVGPSAEGTAHPEAAEQGTNNANRRMSNLLRKPLPTQLVTGSSGDAAPVTATNKSTRRKAVESRVPHVERQSEVESEAGDFASVSGYSSNYAESVVSPLSPRGPITLPTGQQVPNRDELVRTGVKKLAGGTEADREVVVGDVKYRQEGEPAAVDFDIPGIDFGPTRRITPEAPGQRKARPVSYMSTHRLSQENLLTLAASQRPQQQEERPGTAPDMLANNRRSVAWQPSGGSRPVSRQDLSMSPEEFVQQRSAPGRSTPVFSPNVRQQTAASPRDGRKRLSKTPPGRIQGASPADWSSFNAPAQASSRPHSRGASQALAVNPDLSQRLTAREQEHVARVTNTPLINLASHQQQQQQKRESNGGLVSAIAAREQEKQAMKAGYGGQMVQQAIAQRNQQQQAQPAGSQPYDRRPSPGNPYAGQYGQMERTQGMPSPGYPASYSPNYSPGLQGYQPGHSPSLSQGPLPGHHQGVPHLMHQQLQYQDGYVLQSQRPGYSPSAQSQYAAQTNRLSYQHIQPVQISQRTPSPNIRGHRPQESYDSYFRPS